MGLFDIFLSPEKQIEKENKLLAKDNRTVAVVTSYHDWEQSESITLEDGSSDIRSYTVEQADFKLLIDGQLYEHTIQPREGRGDFIVGEQWIVKYDKKLKAIIGFDRKLRGDSPNQIKI